MKILFISSRFSGGIGGHASRVAEKLTESGYEVKLASTMHVPIKNLKNPSFAVFSSLRAIFQNEKYDIVHAFNIPSSFAMKYTKARKKVLSIHGMYSEQVGLLHSSVVAKRVSANEQRMMSWADKLTTDSRAVRDAYAKKGMDFEFLPGPIDTKKLEKINSQKKDYQIAYVGRDSYEKGIDILKSIESDLNGNVIYCTKLEWKEAMSALKSSSVLVVPSRMESLPQVIKEALYLKVPVIATNVGGVSELITDGENGLLVEPDNPVQLTETINGLLGDQKRARKISDSGYDFVMKNFAWEAVLPRYLKFYKDLLE